MENLYNFWIHFNNAKNIFFTVFINFICLTLLQCSYTQTTEMLYDALWLQCFWVYGKVERQEVIEITVKFKMTFFTDIVYCVKNIFVHPTCEDASVDVSSDFSQVSSLFLKHICRWIGKAKNDSECANVCERHPVRDAGSSPVFPG